MIQADGRTLLELGRDRIPLQTWRSSKPRWKLLHLHANERTSLRAAVSLSARRQIEVCSLRHAKGRRLEFTVGDQRWTLDPNRSFSRQGVLRDLIRGNGRVPSEAVVEAACGFGEALYEAAGLERGGAVVAIHNNTDDGTFTIDSFCPGGELAHLAARAVRGPGRAPSDFFYVTREAEFEPLAQLGWNVVLQAPEIDDDGSLSIRCAHRGVPYINVEARHARRGHEQDNAAMIIDALHVLEQTCGVARRRTSPADLHLAFAPGSLAGPPGELSRAPSSLHCGS